MRFRAMASAVVVAALVGTLAVSSWGHRGSPSSQLELNPGTAWFADQAAGRVSLLDGATALAHQRTVGTRRPAPVTIWWWCSQASSPVRAPT